VRRAVQPDDELSVRLLFSADAGLGTVNQLLDNWYQDLWLEGKRLERAQQRAFHAAAEGTPRLFSALPDLLSRRQKRIAADLEFIEEFRKRFATWVETQESSLVPELQNGPAPRRRGQATTRVSVR
jgi:hypothetical protein